MQRELKSAVDQMLRSTVPFKHAVAEFKKRYIQKALDAAEGDTKRAAKLLGMNRENLRSKVKKYKVRVPKRNVKGPKKKKTPKRG